jgi:hypothetical protein
MGNICSSSKNEPEAFSAPGRVLGSSTANNTAPRASVPAGAKSKQSPWKSPGRTLGGGGSGGGSAAAGSSTGPGPGTETAEDARARAAAAAQVRFLVPYFSIRYTLNMDRLAMVSCRC